MTKVSACLIVRDEEENLELCLEALEPWVDEICVLDTGSTDGSVALAESLGARVGHFEWCDDFAAARNACLDLASGDWILSVDADELLDPESAPLLRACIEVKGAQAFLVWLDNLNGTATPTGKPGISSVGIPRLFRRCPEIRWARAVHESVMASLTELGLGDLEHSGLRLVHSGYLPEVVRSEGKRERNLSILERTRRAEPADLFNLFKLAGTLSSLERDEEALGALDEAWRAARELSPGRRNVQPFLALVASELIRLASEEGLLARAREVAAEAIELYPTISEVLYYAGEACRRTGALEAAARHYADACGASAWTDLYSGDPATRSFLPLLGLARVGALAGDLGLARRWVDQALELAPREVEVRALSARLEAIEGKEQESWRSLGELLEEAPGHPDVTLLAAEMAWARGEVEIAHNFWLGAAQTRRGRHSARAWLAILDLVSGELGGAQTALANLRPVDLPEAGAQAVLAAVARCELELDPIFESAPVVAEVAAWLSELSRDPEQGALTAYSAGTESIAPRLPEVRRLRAAT